MLHLNCVTLLHNTNTYSEFLDQCSVRVALLFLKAKKIIYYCNKGKAFYKKNTKLKTAV